MQDDRLSSQNRVQIPRSGLAEHAPGFMPGVLTTISREMVTIPRVELGAFHHAFGFMPEFLTNSLDGFLE